MLLLLLLLLLSPLLPILFGGWLVIAVDAVALRVLLRRY